MREVTAMTAIYHSCRSLLNRRVRIRMKSGETHIGKVVKVTNTHVYLQKSRRKKGKTGTRFFFAPFILPLVLFNLLTIALIV
jgi:ferredoxin-fold anticodon binding domain-containing protein